MHFNILSDFRNQFYACFDTARDSLFNVADALLTDTNARSLPELSLSVFFERRWPSVYAAFADGWVNRTKLRRLFANFVQPPAADGAWLVVGVDASNIARPQSPTAPDRSALFVHNLPDCDNPVTYGWQFSMVALLPLLTCSWCYILDCVRISSDQTPATTAADQLQVLTRLFEQRVLVVADRYYGSASFLKALGQGKVDCAALLRLKKNSVFCRPAPDRTGKVGRPALHGAIFKCKDSATHGCPDRTYQGQTAAGESYCVEAWDNLHFRRVPLALVSVLRVTYLTTILKNAQTRSSWFVWYDSHNSLVLLDRVVALYARRFSLEHTFRFLKQDLLWEKPRLRSPEQFQLWTDLVAGVMNQLGLAAQQGVGYLQPWETKREQYSPQQVRRAMGRIISELGTPARPPQVRGKAVGWLAGRVRQRAMRYPVIKKAGAKPQKRLKVAS